MNKYLLGLIILNIIVSLYLIVSISVMSYMYNLLMSENIHYQQSICHLVSCYHVDNLSNLTFNTLINNQTFTTYDIISNSYKNSICDKYKMIECYYDDRNITNTLGTINLITFNKYYIQLYFLAIIMIVLIVAYMVLSVVLIMKYKKIKHHNLDSIKSYHNTICHMVFSCMK